MNDETAREKLAAALWLDDIRDAPVKRPLSEQRPGTQRTYERAAAALLPVVREIVAEELRRAYIEDSTTVAKLSPVERLTCRIVKVEDLLPRIAALDLTKAAS